MTDGEKKIAQIPVAPSWKWKQAESRLGIRPGVRPLYVIYLGKGKLDLKDFTIQ